MGRIEDLADQYGRHIAIPWPRTVAGAQRVIMVVYEKELERTLRARGELFQIKTIEGLHEWYQVDLAGFFGEWMAKDEYREAYFETPEDLELKLEAEFAGAVADHVRETLTSATDNSVVALFGVGSLFGFARVSEVLRLVETDIKGRLVVFFPGQYDQNNYRLLDARDGWNYLATPITAPGAGASR